MNSEITIREAALPDVPGIARVHIDTWQTTYRDIVPDDFLAQLSYDVSAFQWETRIRRGFEQHFLLVADIDGHVIGFSSGGPNRVQHPEITGEVYAIYILEEYQGKGIGRRLLAESVQRLRALDHAGMLIWVLDENPGRKFYESCGGVPVEQREIVIGGAALAETGYGWKSLDTFEQ